MPTTNTTALEALRQQFEDAYVAAYPTSSTLDSAQFHREADGQYERVQVQTAWTLYCAALESSAPSAAEPFAWIWQLKANPSKTGVYLENPALSGIDIDSSYYIWTKVYDHSAHPAPAPSAASEREALTDEQADMLIEQAIGHNWQKWHSVTTLRCVARHAAIHSTGKPDVEVAIPKGYALVPITPTADMRVAGREAVKNMKTVVDQPRRLGNGVRLERRADAWDKAKAAWEAMVNAAPADAPVAEPVRWIRTLENGSEIVYQSKPRDSLIAVWAECGDKVLEVYSRPPAPEDAKDAARKPLDKADQKWCCYGGGVPRENCDFPCAARAALSQGGGA